MYNKAVSQVNLKESVLTVDCIRLETPTGRKLNDVIRPCFELYKSSGFKRVDLVVCKAQKCLKEGVIELAKEVGIDNFNVVVSPTMMGTFSKKGTLVK